MILEASEGLGVGICATFRDVRVCTWNSGNVEMKDGFVSLGMHTQLLPFVKSLLEKSGHSFQDVKFLVMDTGPGESFTGLRLSLAFVKSWHLVHPQIQLYTTSSMKLAYDETLQKNIEYYNETVVVGFWGFQKRAYIQSFREGHSISPILDLSIPQILEHLSSYENPILVGNTFSHSPLDTLNFHRFVLAGPHIEYAKEVEPIDWKALTPQYYRKTTAEENFHL